LPRAGATDPARMRLRRALDLVDKLLADREPGAQDRLASAVDPEARVGMHGGFFLGYLLDMTIDADSEIITAVNVLPGNGPEAADAITLIRQEETAQGNDIEGISIDGAGYNGPVLRELTDPAGLNVDVTVPPPTPAPRTTFGSERFTLKVLDGQRELTCPAGQTTRARTRTRLDTGDRYLFSATQCAACPLRGECLENPDKPHARHGRAVTKNDYEAEYQKVHAKAQTSAYAQTRRTHPKIERKLNEIARHHRARRASYRGRAKVLVQAVLTALAVNVKRIVKLLRPAKLGPPTKETVRAEAAWTG
jgi:Transposase DDE domain